MRKVYYLRDTHTGRLCRLMWAGDHWRFTANDTRFAVQPLGNIFHHLRLDGYVRHRKRDK